MFRNKFRYSCTMLFVVFVVLLVSIDNETHVCAFVVKRSPLDGIEADKKNGTSENGQSIPELEYSVQDIIKDTKQSKTTHLDETLAEENSLLDELPSNEGSATADTMSNETHSAQPEVVQLEITNSDGPLTKGNSLLNELSSNEVSTIRDNMSNDTHSTQTEVVQSHADYGDLNTDEGSNQAQDGNTNGNTSKICLTEQCTLTAARVISAMDKSIDPCENFYGYACGHWSNVHELPADRSNLYSYGVLRDEVRSKTQQVLEEEVQDSDIEAVRNAKYLYQSCMNNSKYEVNNTQIEGLGREAVYPLLEELGGWPLLGDAEGGRWNETDFDLITLLIRLLRYNNNPIISPWVGLDDKNNTRRLIFIDQTWFGLPERSYYLKPSLTDKLEAYREFIISVGTLLGANSSLLEHEANELVEFETALANITVRSEDRRDAEEMYNLMTIKELSQRFPPLNDSHIEFDWLRYLQEMMALADVPINETEQVVIVSMPYYDKLFETLNMFSKRTIANYAVWRIIRNRVRNLPEVFRNARFKLNKVLYGSVTERQRWKTCTDYANNNFGMITGKLFVEAHFNEKSKDEVKTMIDNIRSAFRDTLNELDWMDDQMKAVANEKADAIDEAVAYPDYLFNNDTLNDMYANMTMDPNMYFQNVLRIISKSNKDNLLLLRKPNNSTQTRWSTNPTTVNAYYSFQRNQITFPAGILQPPYFHIGQPRSMNYGGIGFLMGHEITHGFDDRGRSYDKDGNLNNWWTDEAAEDFTDLSQCLIDQYSGYVQPEVGLNVNGINTLGENIADNGGMKQAYRAYRQWVHDRGLEEPTLPGMNLTNNQLFFINLAQIRCGMSTKDDAVNHILTGAHSPNMFRVIGTLQNMPEFSQEFKCSNTSYMNPAKKCSVW